MEVEIEIEIEIEIDRDRDIDTDIVIVIDTDIVQWNTTHTLISFNSTPHISKNSFIGI